MPITSSALPALPVGADTRSMTERVNAIIKNLYNKLLPVGAASTVLTSDGTTFSWAALPAGAITNTGATTFLTADVPVVTINTFVNGPNTGSIGANGQTWLITAGGTFTMGSAGQGAWRIFDGTSDRKSSGAHIALNNFYSFEISTVVVLTGATTFTLQVTDNVGGSVSNLKATCTNGTTNKATSITAVRLA